MTQLPAGLRLCRAHDIGEIPTTTFYRIAQLRQQVFGVEQECAYLDLDGRDLEAGCAQLWAEDAEGAVVATMRVLDEQGREPGMHSIGRVATATAWRGRGVAAALLEAAIAECGDGPILIHAQAHLAEWYGRFGFVVCGAEFLEDGIPHLPMRIR
ncbi:GNAT family N-acetyltransferase [Leucobacter massiliensis]|uniref:GNAT family N-acetyltransferase n=1 Tax=Leucobacter massiliensis TaxID=1686285 RepID=A0A2S9QS65_9MICO|nr:GNAT family N-acetyltransferase [Leucobacter massiliensis]PRI12418.1 GNAT family N-acetyltransferase [Leucobacter massiliensis]